MKRYVGLVAGLCASLSIVQAAQARTYIVEKTVSPYVSCYNKEYVPAQVRVNTRGKLVRGTQQYWSTSDTTWNLVRDPSVYIQTQQVVEPDHYTLVPTGCP